jgi:heat shock protein HslJ
MAVAWMAAVLLTGGVLAAPLSQTASTAVETASNAQAAATPAPESSLAGTAWRLVEFQSMDDSIGTLRPDDPSLYTMRLNGDGTVDMRLNCNRANGTWSSEPGADGSSGRFEFGPLAATRALCPPPSRDERIAADAQWIRGYMLRDGNLYLSLMADGGIYAWEPGSAGHAGTNREAGQTEVPFETDADAEVEDAVLRASPDYTPEVVEITNQPARYLYSRFDLDGDGNEELFVYLLGSIFCGSGGCDLLLFTEGEDGYDLVNTFPISRLPVIVSPETTAGWKNVVRLESGGGAPATYVTYAFDSERYAERQRVPADTELEGTKVLAGDFTFADGIPLEPRMRRADGHIEEGGAPETDVKVPGTDFHATGQLPCARYEGQPMGQCEFGVKREGNGDAELTVFWSDGGTRKIVFEDGAPVSSDASEKLTATKQSDLHLVRIGPERIEVPDAVVFGG